MMLLQWSPWRPGDVHGDSVSSPKILLCGSPPRLINPKSLPRAPHWVESPALLQSSSKLFTSCARSRQAVGSGPDVRSGHSLGFLEAAPISASVGMSLRWRPRLSHRSRLSLKARWVGLMTWSLIQVVSRVMVGVLLLRWSSSAAPLCGLLLPLWRRRFTPQV
jgi:hypothetical protein